VLLDLLLPDRCAACGAPRATGLCPPCTVAADALALADLGRTLLAPGVLAVAAYRYDAVVAAAIRGVKVHGATAGAKALGDLLRTRIRLPPAPLTWVPSTPRRVRERGADVARLLAGGDAVPLLRRTRERPDQTTLDAAARRRSPDGSFTALARVPSAVVLVDDVRTTGATARAAALALQGGGARRVLVVTLALAGADAR
jgi:predicted amidophosphoribosyltransferase